MGTFAKVPGNLRQGRRGPWGPSPRSVGTFAKVLGISPSSMETFAPHPVPHTTPPLHLQSSYPLLGPTLSMLLFCVSCTRHSTTLFICCKSAYGTAVIRLTTIMLPVCHVDIPTPALLYCGARAHVFHGTETPVWPTALQQLYHEHRPSTPRVTPSLQRLDK